MRLLTVFLMAAWSVAAAESRPAWPFWDDAESIQRYAQRANLPPTKTLDLGDGVNLELVLIPAGTFTMGTAEPVPPDEEPFANQLWIGFAGFVFSAGVLFVLALFVVIRANRAKRWPQVSLARLLAVAVIAGGGLLGFLHYWHWARKLAVAQSEYQVALARFGNAENWEKPAHKVTISTPYYMGKFEVTQAQYQQAMGVNPSQIKGLGLPVDQISWNDAQEFCKRVSEKAGVAVGLPSEAEWEYACRAGTSTTYCTGDAEADLDRAAWYHENSKHMVHPVGKKAPNAWGLHDMHGNVWEWCADWCAPYAAEAVTDPQGAVRGRYRVFRGGSWSDGPEACRSTNSSGAIPRDSNLNLGFRVVVLAAPRTP